MKKVKFDLIKIAFFVIFITIIISLSQVNIKNNNISFLVCFTFLINIILSVFMIIREKKIYSLYKTYWYFSLIFFCFAPIIQYLSNRYMWKFVLSNHDYIITNLFILFSHIIFIIIYELKNKKYLSKNSTQLIPENIEIRITILSKFFLLLILLFCLLFSVKNIGLSNLFSMDENTYSFTSNSMFNTIFSLLCRGVPVYIFYIFYTQKRKFDILTIISFVIVLILNFPTSTTRFWMGSIYIGLFLLAFNKNNSSNRKYDVLLLATFSLIFPMLFSFKYHDINYFIKNGFQLNTMNDAYNSVDYDAYSLVPSSIIYVQNNGIVNGKQLLGTVLFFIPRQFWNNKPNPTGDLIARARNQSFTNISCPFISEGYVNFGIFGTVVFQIILALICVKLDYNYWYNKNSNILLRILYPFLMGFLIYFLRGALHPAVVYLFCFCLPLILVNIIIKKGEKNDFKSI